MIGIHSVSIYNADMSALSLSTGPDETRGVICIHAQT